MSKKIIINNKQGVKLKKMLNENVVLNENSDAVPTTQITKAIASFMSEMLSHDTESGKKTKEIGNYTVFIEKSGNENHSAHDLKYNLVIWANPFHQLITKKQYTQSYFTQLKKVLAQNEKYKFDQG